MEWSTPPVSHGRHGKQHLDLSTWIGFYAARTPGVDAGNESTVILAGDNELQPDVLLRTEAGRGGRSVETDGEYLQGAPDLVAEVAASSKARDLGPRKKVLRENGAREYLLWRVVDRELDWFELHDGEYRRLERDADGLLKSGIFPGLWLDVEALLRRDITAVLATLERGMASSEYGGFDERVRGDSGE